MVKKLLQIISLVLVALILSGCTGETIEKKTTVENDNKNTQNLVGVSIYPVYIIAKEIVGNTSQVISAIPINQEPHEAELSSKDIAELSKVTTFIKIGGGFENIENQILSGINTNNNINVIDSSKEVKYLNLVEEQKNHTETLGHEESGLDPHIWLSISNQKIMAKNIYEALSLNYPENKLTYTKNYNMLIAKLDLLDSNYKTELKNCKLDTILVNHNAYNYLGNEYGIKIISISGLEPEVEPSPKQIKELIDVSKEKKLKYIFYEERATSDVAEVLAKEVGAKILVLNTLETNNGGDDFILAMQNNLKNIKLALECE